MGKGLRAFSKQGAVDDDAVAAALQPSFSLASGPEGETTHTWLDTFDWRLHSAGVCLEFVDDGPLIMQLPDGTRLQAPRTGVKWPAHPHTLPDGRLRDALTPIVAPRALLPVVTVRCLTRESRVLNSDEKTVARLVTESVGDGAGQLRIQPLRGYDDAGDRIARLLAGVEGLTAVTSTPYDLALISASRRPGGPADDAESLRPEMSAAVAIAEMLERFAAAIEENVPGTIAAIDTEFLHDLRVAVRRTRSILKLAGDVLPGGLAERFSPAFKWLGDLTTPVRDLDVYLLELDTMAGRLTSADPQRTRSIPIVSGAAPGRRASSSGARPAVAALSRVDERVARRAGGGGRRHQPRADRRGAGPPTDRAGLPQRGPARKAHQRRFAQRRRARTA